MGLSATMRNQKLYQVSALINGVPTPVSPWMKQEVCDELAANLRRQIAAGKLKGWADPMVAARIELVH